MPKGYIVSTVTGTATSPIRPLIGFLFLSLMFTAFGCQKSRPSASLKVNLYNDPKTVDPRQISEIVGRNVALMLYEGLTRIGPGDVPTPAVAKRWEVSEEGRKYTFFLRGSKWSNGDDVTAEDFLRSWKSQLDPEFPSSYGYQLFVIKNAKAIKRGDLPADQLGAKAITPHTIEVELEHPAPYFLSLIALPAFFPIHELASRESEERLPTNGPFVLREWRHDAELILDKNSRYWDAAKIKFDSLLLPMIDNENTALLMFEQGELDYAGPPFFMLPFEAIKEMRAQNKIQVTPVAAVYWLKLNTTLPPLNNQKVRQALSMALDRTELSEYVTEGIHEPASGVVPSLLWGAPRGLIAHSADNLASKRFQEGLQELGLSDGMLSPLELSFNQSEDHLKIATCVQRQWERTLGITVVLRPREWHDHISRLHRGDFQIGRLAWQANFPDPIDFLLPFKHNNSPEHGAMNDTGWEDHRYQQLLEEAEGTTDPALRTHCLAQAEELLVDEMPVIPLFFLRYPYCLNPAIKGMFLSQLTTIDFRWANAADVKEPAVAH